MKPTNNFKITLKPVVGYLFALNLVWFTGCANVSERAGETTQTIKSNTVANAPSKERFDKASEVTSLKETVSSGLSAKMMTQILTAELLVEKGLPAKAFELIYPIVQDTRDSALAKRAFELSMSTYNEAEISKATQLWLEIEPNDPTPWRAMYLISLRQGNLPLASEQWDQYRSLSDETMSEEILSTAQRVARSAQADIGMPFFEQIVTQYDDFWQVHYAYAVLATHYNQPQKAVDILQTALVRLEASDSKEGLNYAAQTQIYQLLSEAYLQFSDPKVGLEVLKTYLQTQHNDWLVQERVARLEVKAHYLSDAEARYQRILNANPEANTSRLSLALLQIELDKRPQAELNLLQVTKDKAYKTIGFYYLGVLSQAQQRTDDALAFFNQVEEQPYVVDAKLHIAEIMFPSLGLPGTLAILDSIPATDVAAQVKVLRAKAIFYRASNAFRQSADMYAQALELAPGNVEMLLAQAVLFYELQAFPEYIARLEQVLAIDPDSVDALNALGYYYVEQGISLDKATVLLERALVLAPDSFYILDSVGWLAYQKKDYVKAEKYLMKALALEHDEEIIMHLIAARWQSGKQQQAKQLWREHYLEFAKNKRYQMLIENLQSGAVIK